MNTEIRVALIGLASALIGAALGAGASIWITQKQLSLSRQAAMLESLGKELDKLEMFSRQLNDIKFFRDKDPSVVATRQIETFQNVYSIIAPSSHLLSRGTWEKLHQVAVNLDVYIQSAQTNQVFLQQHWPTMVSEMNDAMPTALNEIEESRRTRQEEITRIRSLFKP